MYKQDSNKLVQTTRTTTITSHKTVTVDDYRNNVALYPQWQKFLDEIWMTIGKSLFKYLINRDDLDKN
jgi:hypothetical protein